MDYCSKSVPHILEKIFLFLDYESYKKCIIVNKAWNKLIMSKSMQRKAKYLFRKDIEKDQKKLWIAVEHSDSEETTRLLSSGLLDLNHINDLSKRSPYGDMMNMAESILHRAVKNAHKDVVKLLLDKGAEPNVVNHNKETPLSLATYYQSYHDLIDVAKLLLDAGADPNKVDIFGLTPLYTAASNSLEMVKLLVARGAYWTSKYIDHALEHGRTDIVAFLEEQLK